MKQNILITCLIITIMLTSTHATAQTEDDKRIELGKQVFTALKTNDVQLYKNLYPNFEEYKSLMQQMVDAKIDGVTQQQMDSFLLDYKSKSDSAYQEEFTVLRKQADSLHINWNETEFISFESIAAFPEKITIKYIDGSLKFKFRQSVFMIDVEGFEFNPHYKLQAVKNISKYE